MSLPCELMHIIGLSMPIIYLPDLIVVNKMWYRVLNTNRFWRERYHQDFPHDTSYRTLQYSDYLRELFIHPQEIDYFILYRVTYHLDPYFAPGRILLSRSLTQMKELLSESVIYVCSESEQAAHRQSVVGDQQAQQETYTEGYSTQKLWRIKFVHNVHPYGWCNGQQMDRQYNVRNVGRVPYYAFELRCKITFYPDATYFHIMKESYPREFLVREGIPLHHMSNVFSYFDRLAEEGYIPIMDRIYCTEDEEKTYYTLLGLECPWIE